MFTCQECKAGAVMVMPFSFPDDWSGVLVDTVKKMAYMLVMCSECTGTLVYSGLFLPVTIFLS